MEIHRVDHVAFGRVLQMHVDSVADANAHERTRHLAVEGPVAERGAFRETAFHLDGEQVQPHGFRIALADRRRQIGRRPRNIGLNDGLSRWRRRHQELTFHAGETMTRHIAIVEEVAGLAGTEHDAGAGALVDDARRAGILIREDDVVLGALAVNQRHLHHLPFDGGENRIDLAVDGATDAQEHHASLGDARAQRILGVRQIGRDGTRGRLRRGRMRDRCLGGGRWSCGVGRRRSSRGSRLGRRCQEGNDVGAIRIGLQAGERHLVAGHDLLRILQISVEFLRSPGDAALLHRGGEAVVGDLAGLGADDPGQAWTEQILARLHRMAGLTLLEDLAAVRDIALDGGAGNLGDDSRLRRRRLRHLGHVVAVRMRRSGGRRSSWRSRNFRGGR